MDDQVENHQLGIGTATIGEYMEFNSLKSESDQGDTKSAKKLLLRIAEYLRSGKDIPTNIKEWVADAFEEIASSDKPHANRSLRVTLGQGKSGIPPSIESSLVDFIYYSELPRHKEPGGAYYIAAKKFPVSASSAQKKYEKHYRAWIEDCNAEEDKIAQLEKAGLPVDIRLPPF
jgi:hypothetical protein